MSIFVNREILGNREFIGEITYDSAGKGKFIYDAKYLNQAKNNGELGISELLPLDTQIYSSDEIDPFFSGLMPEGEVINNLSVFYQVPRSNYLAMLEQMGCESIGALTFISSDVNSNDYKPFYKPVDSNILSDLATDPIRAATAAATSTRLSLAGAQSKVAWCLFPEVSEHSSLSDKTLSLNDWKIPCGTAASSHIIKISRRGEEQIALNELACSILAKGCGIETAKVAALPEIPGAIAVERYDRIWVQREGQPTLMRLHQEDFCQALGLPPYFKYQPPNTDANYPCMMADLVRTTSENPQDDLQELVKRILFCFAIGNSDAHLKNFSLLYNQNWTARKLSPFYDVTCIPLTGYSTAMPFDVGEHRKLDEIDAKDITILTSDMDISFEVADSIIRQLLLAFDSPSISPVDEETQHMIDQILDNSKPRIKILKDFMG